MVITQNITNGWQNFITLTSTSNPISITNIPSNINNVLVIFTSISGTTVDMRVTVSTNNGSSYVTTGYTAFDNYNYYNQASYANMNSTTNFPLMPTLPAGTTLTGLFYLMGLNTSNVTNITGQMVRSDGYGAAIYGVCTTSLVNAFQMNNINGALASGTIKVYGF